MFAIDLLKQLLCGKNIWRNMCKFIKVGASYAKIDYDISLESEKYGNYLINYSVTFKIKSRDTESMDMDVLGEILTILQESAKGQLIFTSHNLRALEVLDKKSVMFSTTNEDNRYIRFKNVKGTNNLRDMYYQDILLSGQDECIYKATSQSSIRRAFRRAGGDLNG